MLSWTDADAATVAAAVVATELGFTLPAATDAHVLQELDSGFDLDFDPPQTLVSSPSAAAEVGCAAPMECTLLVTTATLDEGTVAAVFVLPPLPAACGEDENSSESSSSMQSPFPASFLKNHKQLEIQPRKKTAATKKAASLETVTGSMQTGSKKGQSLLPRYATPQSWGKK